MNKRKQNRHEKVIALLLSGKPISPDEIKNHFIGTDQEKLMYRLAMNIHCCRLDGGVIKVYKDGRKISAYQLLNPECFSSIGRYIGFTKKNTNNIVGDEVIKQTETEIVYA